MQKRMVRKLDLEIEISKIAPHPSPTAYLEQYAVTPEIAAQMLYMAAYVHDHIVDKRVVDLGCGTGRLAIGSALLGAKEVVGVDIDRQATAIAMKNAERLGMKEKIQWITADIVAVTGDFDTVLQNPPFGVQRRNADRKFIQKALEIAENIYSLHKSSKENRKWINKLRNNRNQLVQTLPSPFLRRLVEKYGGETMAVYTMLMTIPHTFYFHRKSEHKFLVDIYVIKRCASSS